ncbi:DUF6230 family protein [Streptomyces sp. URMC 123]|uniref:DUF6230 family protein n=1 Tax=Streptomyces sp. URMC 123 TaxID=3423403 RepID=UPI003F1DB113
MESLARGGTRWKRFAVVMVPSVTAAAAIGVAIAQGALAASFSVSGQQFKVEAKHLEGWGFMQYGAYDTRVDKQNVPVAVSAFKRAEIKGMCQSVVTPNIPGIGTVTLKLNAGTSKPVEATNLYIDVAELDADATFDDINIGVAAGASKKGPGIAKDDHASPAGFAQEADHAVLTGVKQKAWATSAGTFTLNNLKLRLLSGTKECYEG